jgi:hypothetical protein
MDKNTDKIYTDGAHIYDADPDDDRFAYCRDCGVKCSEREIREHIHRHKCSGDR